MSIKVALEHRTTYRFDRPVGIGPHVVRLRPAPHCRTPIESYALSITPADHFLNWQQDPFGNYLARIVFPNPSDVLEISVGLVADLGVINPFDFFVEAYAERFPFRYAPELAADLQPYLEAPDSARGPRFAHWVEGLPAIEAAGQPIVSFLSSLNSAVNRDVAYSVRMEAGVQTPDETLARAIGSCRDSAWLLVSALRCYGLAARFVSGYLVQLTADIAALDGPTGPTEDFTDLHAWAEVYIPGAGWIGLDPTSALFAGEGHIPLAATPQPGSAAAISGATEPSETTMEYANVVRRIHEDPRVTKPYTGAQREAQHALGAEVDARLAAAGLELTMGGEPTFVAVDHPTLAEWTIAADGPDKRERANTLAAALAEHYAVGGLVQRSEGKWYPGESLPRWQIGLIWRTDGEPLWSAAELLVDLATAEPDDGAPAAAEAYARRITADFGLPPEQLRGCYEDPLAVLVADVGQPDGPRPGLDPDHPDPALVAKLDGEVEPVAWALPLVPSWFGEDWVSPDWRTRRQRLVLVPGDSPAGSRLPLRSLSWRDPDYAGEESYLRTGPPLPDGGAARPRAVLVDPDETQARTAVVVQARDGFVHVFLPPLEKLEKFVELVRLLDRAAAATGTRLVLEGYGPPPDSRIKHLLVTPDPGVIEVNVHPTSSWSELVEVTTTLHDLARRGRLGTETFANDGRHSGTGGGNHITLGGPEPSRSPLLRRPDLLVSLLTFWQHHPALSYVFSGRFVGPTSQAPRVDEGRPETLYELEISFAEIAAMADDEHRPWAVDRALRHLLTDITGNTHRSEFCIDKLYSPDSLRGRLGLLELRGFEMPPHPEMALVQALLVRALVARFAEEPFSAPLVRWGTTLHERFLLPHFALQDLAEVVSDLRGHGFAVDPAWFAPYGEFRFPRLGATEIGGVRLELRAAIEPWHVLGEEATAGGTARYVDSSTERLQVQLDGFVPGRHLVTCNGVAVPMTATSTPGRFVAGVRYRAWKPWSSLHPTLEIDSPLHLELIDRASRVSLGGATYHVVHPGGRSYDSPPVNATEAEARRARRFEAIGASAGAVDVAALDRQVEFRAAYGADYPLTLDLRRHVPVRWGRP